MNPLKLWYKGTDVEKIIEQFTVGRDRELDTVLAKFDIIGSLAHATMLNSINIINNEEFLKLKEELKRIYKTVIEEGLQIEEGVEDIHSQIEVFLTEKLQDIGEKINSGRSRNDQILLDLRLFIREQIQSMVEQVSLLFNTLLDLSEKYKHDFLPGYTHMQVAMPSSFGLWFAAYAESLIDDLIVLQAAYRIINKNPLGSAAGFGSSLPLNRNLTTKLLGFDDLNYNVVYAQMGRGKSEKVTIQALSSLANTLSKLATDIINYMCQNFNFISFPDKLTTGSSIMPHKKNPDVFEIIRGKCNRIQALPNEFLIITNNLPFGYFRDLQLIKEHFIYSFVELRDCLGIMDYMLNQINVHRNILNDDKYKYVFSVEAVNQEVLKGASFRKAYRKVGKAIQEGQFEKPEDIIYSHQGSIGNLCNDEIKKTMQKVISAFDFKKVEKALAELLNS